MLTQYFGGSQKKYEDSLEKQGITDEQVREELKSTLISEKIFAKVGNSAKVTNAEIQAYYASNPDQYGQKPSRDVRHILVASKVLADDLHGQLENGADFAALAKKYSTDPGSNKTGGKLTIERGGTVPPFDKAAFALKVGELSQPVKTQFGWHIIEALTPEKTGTTTPLKSVRKTISDTLLGQKRSDAVTKWLEALKKEYEGKIEYAIGSRAARNRARAGDHQHRLSLEQALGDLQELTAQLRRECPWDAEQTTRTIVPHTVEEAYEVADAAMADDDAKLVDELGDLLYQTFFLSLLLAERGAGDLETVARNAHEKLVRRHPHVFGDAASPGSPGAVKHRWEELKTSQEGRSGVFHDVPETLPALLYARKVQRRAASTGFAFPDLDARVERLEQELDELREELRRTGVPEPETEPDPRVMDELGDVLFLAVGVAQQLNVDPELALRGTSRKFVSRVERAAALAAESGDEWSQLSLDDQFRFYEAAKAELA